MPAREHVSPCCCCARVPEPRQVPARCSLLRCADHALHVQKAYLNRLRGKDSGGAGGSGAAAAMGLGESRGREDEDYDPGFSDLQSMKVRTGWRPRLTMRTW